MQRLAVQYYAVHIEKHGLSLFHKFLLTKYNRLKSRYLQEART